MLHGQPGSVAAPCQRHLAAWAFNVTLMIDCVHGRLALDQAHRDYLRENKQPPLRDVDAWLAWIETPAADQASVISSRARTFDEATVVTFRVERVAFQIVVSRQDRPLRYPDARRRWDEYIYRIWPPTCRPLAWPPSPGLPSLEAFEALAGVLDPPPLEPDTPAEARAEMLGFIEAANRYGDQPELLRRFMADRGMLEIDEKKRPE